MQKLVCIFSSPRSGSTWLAKILDSRPDVLYLHEPDIEDRGLDLLPFWFSGGPDADELARARAYLTRLIALRTVRTMGARPFFRKDYRPAAAEWRWRATVTAAKAAQNLGWTHSASLKDLITGGAPQVTLLKMVSALGRASRLIPSMPAMQPILIIRNPLSYAASRLRGYHNGFMALPPSLATLADTQSGRELGLTPDLLEQSTAVERIAWDWLIANSEALKAVLSHGGLVLSYDRLAQHPMEGARDLFAQIGFDFSRQTARFIEHAANRNGSYYSVFRSPTRSASQDAMSNTDRAVIQAIVCRGALGRMFFESQPPLFYH